MTTNRALSRLGGTLPKTLTLGVLLALTVLCSPAMAQKKGNGHENDSVSAPEISPDLLLGGLALVVGGTMILVDRRRR
jgi:hypothetical protein